MYQAMYVDIIEGMIVERTYSCLYICLALLKYLVLNISRKYGDAYCTVISSSFDSKAHLARSVDR